MKEGNSSGKSNTTDKNKEKPTSPDQSTEEIDDINELAEKAYSEL